MSRKVRVALIALFIFFMAFYLAYDSAEPIATVGEFLDRHLNNAQQCLYIGSLYMLAVLSLVKMPFLEPLYRVRLKDQLFFYLFQKMAIESLILSVYVFAAYTVSALLTGAAFTVELSYLLLLFKLFSFFLACRTLYTLVYFLLGKEMLGLLCVLAANLLFLSILYGVNYYVLGNGMSNEKSMLVFLSYVAAVNVSGLTFLGVRLERKECLT